MYTRSLDGRMRQNLHLKIRVTKSELKYGNQLAREYGHKNLSEYLVSKILTELGYMELPLDDKKEAD